MKNAARKKIFISYRVQDTAGETGRLVDSLKQYFADDQIFMDIENLEPGADFVESIGKSLDACDVFLAVIGPHWTGDRGDGNIRLNNPNDWVRMEVGTALQRNIRVVPVLVDGGQLPPAEQLPDDLQPLLRRQAIEISNKRWRYDTDQLIQFLIHKAGIQPLKAPYDKQAVAPPEPKKRKTWVYVSAGFALAFVVLIVIGLLMPQERKDNDDILPGPGGNSQLTDSFSMKPNPVVNPAQLQDNTRGKDDNINEAAVDLTGRWKEIDEGITSTFVLQQSGAAIQVQIELNGQIVSTGTGTLRNKDVELYFPLFGFPTVLKGTLSGDNNTIEGNYSVPATGDEQPIQLVRKR